MTGKKYENVNEQTGSLRKAQINAPPPQRILVVEDESNIRRLNIEILRNAGYQVDSAENGMVAWEVLQLHSYDLLVTDNNMPKMTGIELLQKIQAAAIAVPVILATGIMPEENVIRQPRSQVQATLLKPYSVEQLLATVKSVLIMDAPDEGGKHSAPLPN